MKIVYGLDLEEQSFLEGKEFLEDNGIHVDGEIYGNNVLLGKIENPHLALDMERITQLENGELISGLFSHQDFPLTTSYDSTENQWFKFKNTWPPSIDTLVHLNGQRQSKALENAETVLDVACGTGMAGTYAINKNGLKTVTFSDIIPEAIVSAQRNFDNINGMSIKTKYLISDALKNVDGKYDIIIASAIPATPSLPNLSRPINPMFEGTKLLENIIRDAPEHLNEGGKLILSHSSLGDKAFTESAEKYGAKVDKVLYSKDVPFRTEFLDNKDWIDYLVDQHGMRKKNNGNRMYWHTPTVKEISYS